MSTAVKWWRRPWVAPLMVVTVAFLAYSVPPYLTLDPSTTRLPIREHTPLHYPSLVGHIVFGSIALIATCLQVWPWFRGRYPVAHRRIGRIYVFAGVLPSGLLAIPTSAYGSSGLAGSIGNILLAVTWLATTFAGFRMARQKRYAEHRRWMIRSFALCTSIVLNRVWVGVLMFGLAPALASDEAELEVLTGQAIVAAIWLSWVVNLLIAEWWIERTRRPKRKVTPTKEPALVA